MTAENAILWLEVENFPRWRLFRGEEEKEKVSEFDSDSESVNDASERLERVLRLQTNGKYVLKGFKGKNGQAAQSVFRFEIKAPLVNHQPAANGPTDLQALYEKAKTQALEELMAAKWKDDVIKRLDALEKGQEDLREAMLEFHDQDPDNDSDAFERVTDMAARIPKLAEGFSQLKGMFKTN